MKTIIVILVFLASSLAHANNYGATNACEWGDTYSFSITPNNEIEIDQSPITNKPHSVFKYDDNEYGLVIEFDKSESAFVEQEYCEIAQFIKNVRFRSLAVILKTSA